LERWNVLEWPFEVKAEYCLQTDRNMLGFRRFVLSQWDHGGRIMVKLRLARFGAKKKPFYRIVAMDARGKRDGRYIELLGTYDPLQDPPAVTLKMDRVQHWLSVGAQPTEAVERFIKKASGTTVSGS
jgi:small subunit ribosomal protein S16